MESGFSHLNIKLNTRLFILFFLQFFDSLLSFNKSRSLLDNFVVDEKCFFRLLALFVENSKIVPDFRDVRVKVGSFDEVLESFFAFGFVVVNYSK